MPPKRLQPALAFVFAVVLLDVIAIGAVIPVLPKLIEEFAGNTAPNAPVARLRCLPFGKYDASWEALLRQLANQVSTIE